MMIGNGKSTYADSTLKGFKKTTLISIIRCLESNLISADETIDIQAKQCEKLIKSTEVAYYQQGRADAISEVDEKMADILADKCSIYGVACFEAYCDAYGELEDWIAEQLKGEKNE